MPRSMFSLTVFNEKIWVIGGKIYEYDLIRDDDEDENRNDSSEDNDDLNSCDKKESVNFKLKNRE